MSEEQEEHSSVAEEETGSEDEESSDGVAESSPEELLAMGKKSLAAGDAAGAVDNFQEACSILAAMHGQVSKELAEPYYLYGQALLELAREKSAMFGKGIPAGDSGATSSKADVDDASSLTSAPGTGAAVDNPVTTDQPKLEEEESDLQLSWEVLELARLICQRESDDKYRLKLSDVNLALGEVGMESDQYEQAITDLQSCLRLREFVLDPIDRRIAEVQFSLGLAHTLSKQVDEAIAAYKTSKVLLIKRKEWLQEQLAGGVTEKDDLCREVEDLGELIPDIDSKIADVADLKKVLEERENQGNEPEECVGFDPPTKELASKLSAVPVNDITHLIRKRNVPAEGAGGEGANKRVRTEENVALPDSGSIENGGEMCLSSLTPASEQ